MPRAKFGLPMAARIALICALFIAPYVLGLPNLRNADTGKQAAAVEVG